MKRLNIESPEANNFIGIWNINDENICKNIIDFFEKNNDLQTKGQTSSGVNEEVKKSTDITINPNDLKKEGYSAFNDYFKNLNECFMDYKEQYPFLNTFLKKVHIGHFNVQKYLVGDHFARLHSERTSLNSLHRIFAWMTYLNDVDDGGTTDFDYYKIKIKPETGKTLIWPAEWTHAHTGSILKSGSKYIITGWMHFTD